MINDWTICFLFVYFPGDFEVQFVMSFELKVDLLKQIAGHSPIGFDSS